MVDTGAQYSVLNQKDGPMSKKVAGCREQPGLNDMDGNENNNSNCIRRFGFPSAALALYLANSMCSWL